MNVAMRGIDVRCAGRQIDHRLDPGLQILGIGRLAVVEDDEVRCQPVKPEILGHPQGLAKDRHVGLVIGPQQQDRSVAGNPHRPQVALRSKGGAEVDVLDSQPPVRPDQRRCDLAEQGCFGWLCSGVTQLDLAHRPGHPRLVFEGRFIAEVADGLIELLFGLCGDRPEG